jgi:hypothetical protein
MKMHGRQGKVGGIYGRFGSEARPGLENWELMAPTRCNQLGFMPSGEGTTRSR